MQDSFSKIVNRYYEIKNTDNKQQFLLLIEQLEAFIKQHRDVTEVAQQAILTEALELQLILYVLVDEREKAEAIESLLDEEFYGVHRIGKATDKNLNGSYATGGLNISSSLLDFARLKRLAIKQQGTTKPKVLGWGISGIGLALLVVAVWLFTLKWLWTPALFGVVGVFFTTIGSRVTSLVNRFLSTIAFEAGLLIPGVITKVDNKGYEAIFMAPLMSKVNQPERWGLKRITFKKLAGNFTVGDRLAAVSVFAQPEQEYYPHFMPTPVCFGFVQELIPYKAKVVIREDDWQRLNKLIEQYQEEAIIQDGIVVDGELKEIK